MQYKLLQSEYPYTYGLEQEREPFSALQKPFPIIFLFLIVTTIPMSNTTSLILALIEDGNQWR